MNLSEKQSSVNTVLDYMTLDDVIMHLDRAITALKDVKYVYSETARLVNCEKEKKDEIEHKSASLISECKALMNELDAQIDSLYELQEEESDFFQICGDEK